MMKMDAGRKGMAVIAALLMLCSFRLENDQDESTLKALFIYNFTKHIEWPKGKINGKFTIGVIGNSPVFQKLNTIIKDRKIKDHPAELKLLVNPGQVVSCDIVFISRSETYRLKEITEKYDYYGVLIITEDQNSIRKGACINIIEKDQKLKFEIDDEAIKKEGLKISKQLYELAVAR